MFSVCVYVCDVRCTCEVMCDCVYVMHDACGSLCVSGVGSVMCMSCEVLVCEPCDELMCTLCCANFSQGQAHHNPAADVR